jgi:hypothetical protein
LKTRSGFQIGVRIVVPPFPFDDDETFDSFSKDSVIVFKKPPQEEIHIEDVKQVNGQWLVAGTSGVILIVIGMGPTMRQAQSQVYSRIKNVLIPNMYYRTDIGDRWVEDTDRLHTWGFLRQQSGIQPTDVQRPPCPDLFRESRHQKSRWLAPNFRASQRERCPLFGAATLIICQTQLVRWKHSESLCLPALF